jgi:hypothetical protein
MDPKRIALDVEGGWVAVEYHAQFTGKDGFKLDDFVGWGPLFPGGGPLVKLVTWYILLSLHKIRF